MFSNNKFDCITDWIEYNKENAGRPNSLKILQWNIRGMNDLVKFDCIGELLQSCGMRVDVVGVCETWVKTDRTRIYKLDGYTVFFFFKRGVAWRVRGILAGWINRRSMPEQTC